MTTAPKASASPKTVNAVGIRSSGLFPAVELAKKPNKTGPKIIPISSLQETAFLSYSNHRRASNPTKNKTNMNTEIRSKAVEAAKNALNEVAQYRGNDTTISPAADRPEIFDMVAGQESQDVRALGNETGWKMTADEAVYAYVRNAAYDVLVKNDVDDFDAAETIRAEVML